MDTEPAGAGVVKRHESVGGYGFDANAELNVSGQTTSSSVIFVDFDNTILVGTG